MFVAVVGTRGEIAGIRVLDPGSVGLSRSVGSASWMLVDSGAEGTDVEHRTVGFDVEAVVDALHRRRHPNRGFVSAVLAHGTFAERRTARCALTPSGRRRQSRAALADRLDDLAGLEARGADVDPLRGLAHHRTDALDVGVPPTLGAPVRVGDAVSEGGVLAAHLADRCHDGASLNRV
jgi:hypothetical protein